LLLSPVAEGVYMMERAVLPEIGPENVECISHISVLGTVPAIVPDIPELPATVPELFLEVIHKLWGDQTDSISPQYSLLHQSEDCHGGPKPHTRIFSSAPAQSETTSA
jgi:hypothetical protein